MPARYHYGKFPPQSLDWTRLVPLIGPASAAVARYDALLQAIPNPSLLLAPLTTQEAVLSSRIEGTQATMGEVLAFEAGADSEMPRERLDDIQEVLNYRKAVRAAEEMMKTLPLSQRVLLEAHRVLLSGVRGQNKAPGEYRRIPNWIGPAHCTEATARFVPISAGDIPEAMGRWEKMIHSEAGDKLVTLAIAHAEFESIHPFLDGNGRLGRMLVPMYLFEHKIIHRPMFYLSSYLEARRDEYYDRLLSVSSEDDWTGWTEFFLVAISEQAKANFDKARATLDLYNDLKNQVVDWTRSQYAVRALDWIFGSPIFSGPDFAATTEIPKPTAKRILAVFRDKELVRPIVEGRGRRAGIFMFPRLLNLTEGYEAF